MTLARKLSMIVSLACVTTLSRNNCNYETRSICPPLATLTNTPGNDHSVCMCNQHSLPLPPWNITYCIPLKHVKCSQVDFLPWYPPIRFWQKSSCHKIEIYNPDYPWVSKWTHHILKHTPCSNIVDISIFLSARMKTTTITLYPNLSSASNTLDSTFF